MAESAPFLTTIGAERRDADPREQAEAAQEAPGENEDVCVVTCVVEERHCNRGGTIHGGLLSTLLDSSMGGAVSQGLSDDQQTATASLTVSFLAPGQVGDTLIATGQVVKRGSSIAFTEGVVKAEGSDDPIATATATFAVFDKD